MTALLKAGDPTGEAHPVRSVWSWRHISQPPSPTQPLAGTLTKFLSTCQVQGQRVVRISGLQRGWNSPVDATEAPVTPYYPNGAFNPSYTALGAYEKKGAVITGLVYEVDKTAYDATVRPRRPIHRPCDDLRCA